MKFMYPNIAVTSTASSTASGFPVVNINDEHMHKIWKAATTGAITVEGSAVGAPSAAIALFNVNAQSVLIQVYSDAGKTTLIGSTTVTMTVNDEFTVVGAAAYLRKHIWFEFTETTNVYYTLTLTHTGEAPSLGVVAVGQIHTYPNPRQDGFGENDINYAVVKSLRNGADFIRTREFARELELNVEIPVSVVGRDAFQALKRFNRRASLSPFACLYAEGMVDDSSNSLDNDYVIWARFTSFRPTEGQYSHSTVQMGLKEFQ